jgi:plastocyanin
MIDHPVAAAGVGVSMLVSAFAPAHVDVLAGDTVTWSNEGARRHDVHAQDGAWASPAVFAGEHYARTFDHAGAVAYYCSIHPFMRGEVDVHALLLDAPREPGAPGRGYTLAGRAALDPGTTVTVEGDAGAGFRAVASTTVAADGTFRAPVTPASATRYRAVAGDEASPEVQLLLLDRHIAATAVRHGHRTRVRVRVAPASPHATVVLQLHLRERFGWWPVRRARLGQDSTATFHLRLHRRLRARAVLTLADGATPLARSAVLRVSGPRARAGAARSRPRR